mgnify:CR=1 FL=1
MYLTKEMIREALTSVQTFEHELDNLFASYSYSLRDNLGRRNALCSQAQEKELAKSLSKHFHSVVQDGAPGKPDIFIGDINHLIIFTFYVKKTLKSFACFTLRN